jgi:predicted RNase H-like nuclease (RuvC/YqgF family)
MEIDANNIGGAMSESIDKLSAAASLLEKAVSYLEQREAEMNGEVQRIRAAVEQGAETSQRELELERKLAIAEQQISELRAQESKTPSVRKTLPASTTQLLAKGGITALESIEAGALDAALTGLSLEQRIAVKAQLMRAGALA